MTGRRRFRRPPPRRTQAAPYGTTETKIIALLGKNPPGKLVTAPDGVVRAEDENKAAYSGRWKRSPKLLGR
jgi:hypothetical protein